MATATSYSRNAHSSPLIPPVFPHGASYRVSPTNQPSASVYFEDSRPGEDAPVIAICMPGIGDTRRQFRLLAPLLHSQLGLRVLLGDLRGFGDSTDFEDDAAESYSAYSPEAVASDVSQLMDELHAKHPLSEFVLLGNSLSAGSVVLAALEKLRVGNSSTNANNANNASTNAKADASTSTKGKVKVKAVVLLGPILRNSSVDWWFHPLSRVMFRKLYGGALWGAYYKSLYPSKQPVDFESELQLLRSHMSTKKGNIVNIGCYCRADKSGVESAVAAFGEALGALSTSSSSSSPATSPPTPTSTPAVLAFYGRKDPDYIDFDAEVAWIQSKIPSLTLLEDADGGHYPHLEEPQRVADALAQLLL